MASLSRRQREILEDCQENDPLYGVGVTGWPIHDGVAARPYNTLVDRGLIESDTRGEGVYSRKVVVAVITEKGRAALDG